MKKASIIAIVLIMVFAAMGMYAENTKVKVTTRTWVYEEPKSTAKKLAIVEIDQLFEYVNEQTDWYRVKLENGDEGFIRKAHSDLVASDETDMGKSDTIPETTDDWVCTTCNTTASGNFCKNCGAAKPSDSWKCQNCGNNATGNFCSNCGAPKASDVWVCPNCNNTATGKFCSNCGTAKPSNVWTCPACGSTNNGKFCINCGAAYSSKQTTVETPSITTPAPTSDDTLNTGISAQENILFESATAAELLSNAKEHVRTSSKPSPDKYTYYIQDYIGLNLSSIGYTSLGGDRFDRYGASLLKIYPLTLDGTFVDIEDDDILSQYVVVGQNITPNTELNLTYKKDSKGKEYSNLIDYQNVESIDLLVVRIDGKSKDIIIPYEPVAIKAAPDRYTNYVRNYVGKNLSTVGYTSLGGDRMDEYHAAHIKICPVTADGTYIDIEDEDLLQQYVVVGQNIAPNTEMKLVYRKDSKGNEYDNLIDFCSIETIDLQVVRIDGALYNDPVKYDPIPIKVSPNKYTWYMRNYVGKNLLSIGYTSMGGAPVRRV